MPKSISVHCGSAYSRGHNIRDKRYTDNQKHIDPTLSKNNEVIFDCSVRERYKEIFGQAVEEYNAHQRADRRIDDYYLKIKSDKRKNPVYEIIVQIGNKDDTGNLAEKEKVVLREYAKTWEQRNPNLKLTGAYIHADEPNGTVHAHIDFIPVAKSNRGLRVQNSFAKALERQGYKGIKATKTAQMLWQEGERKCVEQICAKHSVQAQANQNLASRQHLSVKEYQNAKDFMIETLENELMPLRATRTAQIDELGAEVMKLQGAKETLSESVRVLSESELERIDIKKKIGGGFKGLTPVQAQQLMNTSKELLKENKKLKEENKTLTAVFWENKDLRETNENLRGVNKNTKEQIEKINEEYDKNLAKARRELKETKGRLDNVMKHLSPQAQEQAEFTFQFSQGSLQVKIWSDSKANNFENCLNQHGIKFKKELKSEGCISFTVPKMFKQELQQIYENVQATTIIQGHGGMSL